MYVTEHAWNRLNDRLGWRGSRGIIRALEARDGERGSVAFLLARLRDKRTAKDGSNGELIFAVAVDGSVETIYFRRSEQDCSPAYFGASRVVDMQEEVHK